MQQDRPAPTVPAPLYSCLYVVVRQLAIGHHLGEEQLRHEPVRQHAVQKNGHGEAVARDAPIKSVPSTGCRAGTEIELDAGLQLMDGSHSLALALYLR